MKVAALAAIGAFIILRQKLWSVMAKIIRRRPSATMTATARLSAQQCR